MNDTANRQRIVDAALALAEHKGWEAVRLHDVAERLSLSLEDIRLEFSEKDQLVDAWFDRADSAMLRDTAEGRPEFLSRRQRFHRAMMAWLEALSSHRWVTRQMILGKLEPGHIHLQIPGLMRVSRTVQWMREAAGYDAGFPRRAIEETIHTSIYLATFTYWMFDNSPHSERTDRFLRKRLNHAEILLSCCVAPATTERSGAADQPPSVGNYDPAT